MSAPASGPWALVTGASSGIGAEIARELAARGYRLILVARRVERLEALRAELAHRVEVVVLPADLCAADAAPRIFEAVRSRGIEVDVLVNNAGHGIQGSFLGMDPDAIDRMVGLNVIALTRLTWLFARDMARRGRGHVLQVASAAAFLPSAYVAAYAATKAYVSSFSEALTFELRSSGVSVTTLYPGITTTEFYAVSGAKTPWLMSASVLDARAVATRGVDAMLRRRRAVVPGWINRVNAVLSQVLPRGLVLFAAGWLLERANRPAG